MIEIQCCMYSTYASGLKYMQSHNGIVKCDKTNELVYFSQDCSSLAGSPIGSEEEILVIFTDRMRLNRQ